KIEKKKKTRRKPGIPTKFSCGNVGGIAEWTLYVDLNKRLAGFFDNNTTAVVPLISSVSLETDPPQTTYTFEGLDITSGPKDRLQIDFNHTKLTASVTLINNNGRAEKRITHKSHNGCVANDKVDINLEEQE
ncbi:MAG: hypothetical protein HYS98_05360, partial [Deltaproteobacteria bacterium]|nr:hypothetical protein [Deltaproteobacteria bacterium]